MKKKTKQWIKCALIRAIKTFAQAVLAGVAVDVAIYDLAWGHLLAVGATATVFSILTSLAGLPEVDDTEVYDMTGGKK